MRIKHPILSCPRRRLRRRETIHVMNIALALKELVRHFLMAAGEHNPAECECNYRSSHNWFSYSYALPNSLHLSLEPSTPPVHTQHSPGKAALTSAGFCSCCQPL